MPSCKHNPLAASADMSSFTSRRHHAASHLGDPPAWPHCCGNTVTRCNRSCAGCTATKISHRLLCVAAIGVYGACGAVLPMLCVAAYLALEMRAHASAGAHLAQVVLCAASAATGANCPHGIFFVWIAFMAAMVHVAIALMILEEDRMGDCRTCCNPVGQCACNRSRRTLPAGSLERLASLVQRRWRAGRALRQGYKGDHTAHTV